MSKHFRDSIAHLCGFNVPIKIDIDTLSPLWSIKSWYQVTKLQKLEPLSSKSWSVTKANLVSSF